jgi:hypothetical protein
MPLSHPESGLLEKAGCLNSFESSPIASEDFAAVIRVYDSTGNVIETHEQAGVLKEQ